MEGFQLLLALILRLFLLNLGKLVAQIIKEQRVNNLMNIFYGGIVHTTAAASFGVQGAFENSAKDGGANQAPIKISASAGQKQLTYFVSKLGNFNVFFCKKATVHIREGYQILIQIWIALFPFGIQYLEKLDNSVSQLLSGILLQIIVEHIAGTKNSRILRIEAENETHAEHVQAA